MKRVFKLFVAAAFAVSLLALGATACKKKEEGPMEKLGKSADKAVNDAQKSVNAAIDKAQKEAEQKKK